MGLLGGSVAKNLPANAGDSGSVPELERSPEVGNGNPLQYSCLGNPVDREARRVLGPWHRKRVGRDLATKQQKQGIIVL